MSQKHLIRHKSDSPEVQKRKKLMLSFFLTVLAPIMAFIGVLGGMLRHIYPTLMIASLAVVLFFALLLVFLDTHGDIKIQFPKGMHFWDPPDPW